MCAITRRLFDHLVGALQNRRRNRKTILVCRLEINHEFVGRWNHNWEVGGTISLEHSSDVAAYHPIEIHEIRQLWAIGDQASTIGEIAEGIDGPDAIAVRQTNNLLWPLCKEGF